MPRQANTGSTGTSSGGVLGSPVSLWYQQGLCHGVTLQPCTLLQHTVCAMPPSAAERQRETVVNSKLQKLQMGNIPRTCCALLAGLTLQSGQVVDLKKLAQQYQGQCCLPRNIINDFTPIVRLDNSDGNYFVSNDPSCSSAIDSNLFPSTFEYVHVCDQCSSGGCNQAGVINGGKAVTLWWPSSCCCIVHYHISCLCPGSAEAPKQQQCCCSLQDVLQDCTE